MRFYFLFIILLITITTESLSVLGLTLDEKLPSFLRSSSWQTTLPKDLRGLKESAILLRCDVPRDNKHFTCQDMENFCQVKVKKLSLKKKYARNAMPFCLRSIQAVAEDQESFYDVFSSKLESLNRADHCIMTMNLIRRVHHFARKYNEKLVDLYLFLEESYPQEECLSEVEKDFHLTTRQRLVGFSAKSASLIEEYEHKIEGLSFENDLQRFVSLPSQTPVLLRHEGKPRHGFFRRAKSTEKPSKPRYLKVRRQSLSFHLNWEDGAP